MKCLFIGAAGVGKTHLIYLLFGWPPPSLRCSTGVAERAIRAIACFKVGTNGEAWEIVSSEDFKSLLADAIVSEKLQILPSPLEELPSLEGAVNDFLEHLGGARKIRKLSSNQVSTQTQVDLVKLITSRKVSGGGRLLSMKWIYIIDSGGQPQFHQLLPAFIRNTTAGVFVSKLSEELSHHPLVDCYDQNGKMCGKSFPSPLSNEDIFQSCVQTVQSLPYTSEEGKSPKLLVVGTYRDKEEECPETREVKNEKLRKILLPTPDCGFHDNIIYCGASRNEILFSVNAKTPNDDDRATARKLRAKIQSLASPPKPIPLQWYGLEMEIERLASSRNRQVVTLDECLKIAQSLHFHSEEDVKAALVYLDSLNIFLYYPSVLPNLVFCNPIVLLDKVTELVQQSYTLKGLCPSDPCEPTEGKWSGFCDRGIISLDTLNDFPTHYVHDLFTANHVLQIFEHLLIIAPINDREYFMPSLLDILKHDDIHLIQFPTEHASGFLLHFPSGYAPCGLSSALVAYLLSPRNNHNPWKLTLSYSGKLHGNCITFSIQQHPAVVTLIDSGCCFEVHVDIQGPSSLCQSLYRSVCPIVRQIILTGLKEATLARNFRLVEYYEAFPCQCEEAQSTPHPATFKIETSPYYWSCTLHPICGLLGDKELVWFGKEATSDTTVPCPPPQGKFLLVIN